MAGSERRKDRRMSLKVPVRVQGYTQEGVAWEEMTTCEDASHGGASFKLKHSSFPGQVLLLALPLPKNFRQYALSDASYTTYALVRSVVPAWEARIGVMFLGKNPPKGYAENPGGRYLLPNDPKPTPKERRTQRRVDVFVNLRLKLVDPAGRTLREEQTVTENLGRGGVRVMTSLPLSKGDRVVVEDLAGTFHAPAEIRNLYIGKDGVPRLNLFFLNGGAPAALIAAAGLGATDL
ncbi:MAG TPA: PilZ domain-containing protein [Candidatus Thermoplasmatota archaeon]